MAAWDNLSIAQRSQLMNIYRGYGITSLSDMRRMYNESHPQLEISIPQTAPMYAGGGDKDTKTKGISKKIANKVSEYTKGLLTPEEASIIISHPKDFSKYLGWDESRVNELKRNLYENFYPYGYDTLAGISAMTGGAGQEEPLGTTAEERMARDYLFAEYLGIPQEDRKEPSAKSMFEDSPYKPSIGNEKDTNYVRFSNNSDRNKVVDIYNSLIGNAHPLPGQKRVRFKAGKNYFSHTPSDEVYIITPGKSRSNFTVVRGGSYDFKNDPYSAALGEYTIGSGFDKDRGQYISVYDKWDLNPVSGVLNLPRALTKRFENLGDASGGFGNPISFYDRVYLDDYYGVNSRPEPDSYYGGYIIPSYVQADASKGNQFKSGGDKDQVRKLIDDWIAANPTYLNMNTADFADWLYETSGLESSWGKNMVGKKSDGTKSGYNGYFGLQVDPYAPFDTQIRKAFSKINQILTDQMTDYDIDVANKMGISQAQLLHKYWNQANRVTNYLHNGIDTTDGAGTRISDYGNNDKIIMDYSSLVRPAITDSTYTVKKGDAFSRIQSAVRVPGRNYNSAGEDLIKLQGDKFNSEKLRIGQVLKLIDDNGPVFEDKGRPDKSRYYTRLNNKDEDEFQRWYFNVAKANGLSLNPNDIQHAYDYRGYWKNATPEELEAAQHTGWHGTDTYKWPTHETFSVESKFYNPKTMQGVGHWEGETFIPGSYNLFMNATAPIFTEFEDNSFASGGKIHIKKKNRGKFTALKKRTGHSASWFKAHGTPAQKKMAVFALNARKWKHSHGGVKF